MPLCEYPCDESWGYQDTGYFSPTSRYGKPEELKAFVDQCHQAGIGVILDFVPVHFAVNDYALAEYDGTALYEYPNMAVGRNEWEAAILCIPEEKFAVFCSPLPITG